MPEAFLLPKRAIPLLQEHDTQKQLGWVLGFKQDTQGLFIEAHIKHDHPLKTRLSLGLSVGMTVLRSLRKPNSRLIQKARLYEISLVRRPAHPRARVTSVAPLK